MSHDPLTSHFTLRDFLPYLTNLAGVKTGLVFSRDLLEYGISLVEWRILIALWEKGNRRLNDVADLIPADLSTTSRQARAMERAGLITRARSEIDGRALSLFLTPKGHSITAHLIPIARMHEQIAIQSLDMEELTILRKCLLKISENLDVFEKTRGN